MPKILWDSFVGAAFGVSICALSASADITTPDVGMGIGEEGSVESTEITVSPWAEPTSLDVQEASAIEQLAVSSTKLETTNFEVETTIPSVAKSEVLSPEVEPDNAPSVDSLYQEEPSNIN